MKKIFFLLFIVSKGFSQAGTFDTTFDTDGIQTFCSINNLEFNPINAGIQSTGKIIQFGYSNNNSVPNLIRYNIDGSIDTTFGNNGRLSLTNNSLFQNQGYIRNFAIQSDDKILVAGEGGNNDYVARLLPNGALDSSFNGQGYLTFSFGTNNAFLYNIITQTDGKILVCGNHVAQTGSSPVLSVARITTGGVLDTTFGSGGIVSTAFKIVPGNYLFGMAVQSDGKILVGGRTPSTTTQSNGFALARLNGSGTVDTSFGTDGIVITSLGNTSNYITKLLVQPDGKIVAGGLSLGMTMVRYLANGALDPTFGNNGVFQDGNSADYCDVVLQPDGKLLLAGGSGTVTSKIFRYTATGVLDSTFANNANLFPDPWGTASNVLLQNDSKILVFGSNYTSDFSQICAVVIRLNNDVLGTEGFGINEFRVFPNPVQNQLSITNEEDMEYELFTILGAKIQAGSIAIHGQVDCSGLAKGLYLLMLNRDNGESKVLKVVKD